MKKTLLITFGCSWTYGVGAGWSTDMSKKQYDVIKRDPSMCSKLSFRGILADRFDMHNLNFAFGGSSNQAQFRRAEKFFISDYFKNLRKEYSDVIVLWGITSTSRNEVYGLDTKKYRGFFYSDADKFWPLSKDFLMYTYDHAVEVIELKMKMAHWNEYFLSMGIQNRWFDTFNHHDYDCHTDATFGKLGKEFYNSFKGADWPTWETYLTDQWDTFLEPDRAAEIKQVEYNNFSEECFMGNMNTSELSNLLFEDRTPRDLLSVLSSKYGMKTVDDVYHTSALENDCTRVEYLTNKKLLNPFSFHPTIESHIDIADLLAPEVEKMIGNKS